VRLDILAETGTDPEARAECSTFGAGGTGGASDTRGVVWHHFTPQGAVKTHATVQVSEPCAEVASANSDESALMLAVDVVEAKRSQYPVNAVYRIGVTG
jgi:hypothetical protein